MKNTIIYITAICMALVFVTCQKATLVESESGQLEGRNPMEEPTDTITVTGDFEAEDWENADSVTFTFGGVPLDE